MSKDGEAEPHSRSATGLSSNQLTQPPPELGDPAKIQDLDLSAWIHRSANEVAGFLTRRRGWRAGARVV
jgi:hypothetical protein